MPGHDDATALQHSVTADGRGPFHEIDPRTGREPAGSGLLARAAAVRHAQETALRRSVAYLAEHSTARWSRAAAAAPLDAFIQRELVPRIFDFIERRMVIRESRDERFYYVTLEVVLDTPALTDALEKLDA